jgi:hypothetical protein
MGNELEALAVRCEALAGPDREVDFLVAVAVNAGSLEGAWKEMSDDDAVTKAGYVRHHFNGARSLQEARRYTSDLNAAMSLVTGCATLISLSEIGADGLPLARVGRPDLDDVPIFEGVAAGVRMDTPLTAQLAIALTAACLKARALTPCDQGEMK